MIIEEKKKPSVSLKMNKFSLNMFKSGNVSQPLSGFLGCMPDCLTMDYVKEEKGIMKMEEMTLCHDDSDVIEWWSTTITDIVSGLPKKPRHLLVFINPFGGKGRGKQLWEEKIADVFKIAGISCKVFFFLDVNLFLMI